jgi:hypothetical protein
VALTLDVLVRAGSGFFFVALGVFVLWLGRGLRRNTVLGTYLASFGASFVVQNLITSDTPPVLGIPALTLETGATSAFAAFDAACLALLIVTLPTTAGPGRRRVLQAAALATAIVALAMTAWSRRDELSGLDYVSSIVDSGEGALTLAWLVALALRFRSIPAGGERTAMSLLASGVAFYRVYHVGFNLAPARFAFWPRFDQAGFVIAGIVLAACVVIWLRNTSRSPGESRQARDAALLIPAVALTSLVLSTFVDPKASDTTGGIGIARILGGGCIAWAILRHDLLGIDLQPRTVHRGTLAAGALAALFIVAQVAQNFFAAQYGLLMGGVVAGAFLFAAQPIQRAMEAKGQGQAQGQGGAQAKGGSLADDRAREIYAHAVRAALADGAMTHDEERHLADLAEHLPIGPREIIDIKHEVEAEMRRKGAS